MTRVLALALVGLSLGTVGASAARSTVLPVTNAAEFQTALAKAQSGDTISFADGSYDALSIVKRHFSTPLRLVGSRAAEIGGITFDDAANISVVGVTIAPTTSARAIVDITDGSQGITLDSVRIDGLDQSRGAYVATAQGTSHITIQHSEITDCGQHTGCIRPAAADLRVLGNRFFDCRSCIFIKGGTAGATVSGNTFQLAQPGSCTGGTAVCPHNDLIAIFGGGPWTITRNRFGEIQGGTAQIYMNQGGRNQGRPIHDVTVTDNIFTGHLGHAVRIGVGTAAAVGAPRNVKVVNNTILSGRYGAIFMNDGWDTVAAAEQPVVANNIIGFLTSDQCHRATFGHNVVLRGSVCSSTDVRGAPPLDPATGVPTRSSRLLVGRGDPKLAPPVDFFGRPWHGPPGIGAVAAPATH